MDDVMVLPEEAGHAGRTRAAITLSVLKVTRFVGAIAMLAAVVTGALGFGPEAKLWVAGAGGLVGAAVAAAAVKTTHAFL